MIGGALALLHAPQVPARVVAEQRAEMRVASAPVGQPPRSASSQPSGQQVALPEPARSSSAPAEPVDLIPSPHDSPIGDDATLKKAERLCIRDVADECVRVADAYQFGTLVAKDVRRAAQYRNLAFKAYIKHCERNLPESCYALARMYLRGDGVKPNPAYAKNLMRRVVEVCRYRRADICERLVQEAPMPPRKSSR